MSQRNALIGFDGFIDVVVHAVDHCDENKKIYINTIEQFGKRIVEAGGKSTNIELDVVDKKIGGNGPILSEALRILGMSTTYIGTLGDPNLNIFSEFLKKNNTFSIGNPGETRAIEFNDGKILLGEMYDVAQVNAGSVLKVCDKQTLRQLTNKSDILCFVNWTMLLNLNSIFDLFLDEIITRDDHIFFFDLADPSKRKKDDIYSLCQYIRKFSSKGFSILGLNLNEALCVLSALEIKHELIEEKDSMLKAVEIIQKQIECHIVFIHANAMSVGYNGDSSYVSGYFSEHPKILTGAGDHFNAGFLFDYVNNHDLKSALHFGSATAKYYVDYACSPNITQVTKTIIY